MNNNRTIIYQTVEQIEPLDEREAQDRARVLEWINSEATLFRIQKPDVPAMHLVSYFVLFDPKYSELMLVDHIKAGLWLPPGGHVEPGELPRAAVEREIMEELGLQAAFTTACADLPLFVTATETRGPGTHTDVSLWYVVAANSEEEVKYDHREFRGYRWQSLNDVLAEDAGTLDPEMGRFVRKLQRSLAAAR